MSRPLRAVIHTQSLQHNLQRARQFAPNSKVMAVIKADGYGHGITRVAEALRSADAFAVASIDEAMTVHDALPDGPSICLLEGVFQPEEFAEIAGHNFMTVIHNVEQVEWLEQASLPHPVRVWLKVNTGMNRLGIRVDSFNTLHARLKACKNVSQLGVMTHFACADDGDSDMTSRQVERFDALAVSGDTERSAANSAGIVQWPAGHYQWVRPGIMLYGSSPVLDQTADKLDLNPAMSLVSELVAVHPVRQGETVGYGADWTAVTDTTIGVVACGYGDGYPRHARAGTPVLVAGERIPLAGRVSMDMITVDLGKTSQAKTGDPVELWGQHLSVDEIAHHADTIGYELLCQVTGRVPREAG